ncbi:MAG: NAD(P)-dependent oxidoreductase [Magnetococcales bacterium]|nr:NAD(P)-dependent oxidoreductase [Magnetococcales bacterium]
MNKLIAEHFYGKNILITGADGFIGQALVNTLTQIKCHITALSRTPAAVQINSLAAYHNVVGDITDTDLITKTIGKGVDILFHLAARTSVADSMTNPQLDLQTNQAATLEILETMRGSGRSGTVIFASTVTVAGLTPADSTDESQQERPITLYDLHKLSAEHTLRIYAEQGWINGCSLRLANVYGNSSGNQGHCERNVFNRILLNAMAGKTVSVYRPGNWIRDYIHLDDVIAAFLTAAVHSKTLSGRPYIIASGHGTTVEDAFTLIVDRVKKEAGIDSSVQLIDPPTKLCGIDLRHFTGNSQAFSSLTGWQPQIGLIEGIDKTIASILKT